MDKPRHPQVIRPWKIQPAQKFGTQKPGKSDLRNLHEGKSHNPRGVKFRGS